LYVWTNVPLEDEHGQPIERGQKVWRDVQAGKLKGFSIDYTNVMTRNEEGETKLVEKKFRDITLSKLLIFFCFSLSLSNPF
jgi:hypothetical protein